MAKLVEEYPSQHDVRGAHKLPSFRVAGGRLVVDNYRGVLRVRFFSEVGHPVRDGKQRYQVDWFRAMCSLWKVMDHRLRMQLEQGARRIHATGRDVFMASMAGRMWIIFTDDGRVILPSWLEDSGGG